MPQADELTPRQSLIVRVINTITLVNGLPPTVTEIHAATGVASRATIETELGKLRNYGAVERTPKGAGRAIRTTANFRELTIPFYGETTC